jgi:tripartite-type tricarboxylate transporter receptor subunit TctC
MVDPPTLVAKMAREGQMRALATTGAARFFSLPEVPTVAESGVRDYVVTSWQGLAGPAGMPAAIVDRLNADIAAILAEQPIIERLRALGNDPRSLSPGDFKARVAADVARWASVVDDANIERL